MDPLTVSLTTFPRLDEYSGLWAIEENAARMLWQSAAGMDFAAHMAAAPKKVPSTMEKLPAGPGKSLAVVRLQGLLMKQQSSMGESTSTIQARRDIRNAVNDPEVSAILLAIDSPGGTVAGTEALANDIRDARKAKPVYAQIEDLGASAAYFAASQAEKIFASTRGTLVGSIGTMMVVHDYSAAAEREGVRVHVYKTGPIKGAGTPGSPVTTEQHDYFAKHVQQLQGPFDDAVMRGRGLTVEQLAAVRTGGVFAADEALQLKLIDGIQSLDTTIDQLTGRSAREPGKPSLSQTAASPAAGQGVSPMDFESYCLARGFKVADLNDTQKASLLADFQASQKTAPVAKPLLGGDGNSLLGDLERRFNEQQARTADIQAICQEAGNPRVEYRGSVQTVYQHAVKFGLSIDETKQLAELANYRNAQPVHSGVASGVAGGADSYQILQCGLEQSLGVPNFHERFSAPVLDLAHKQWGGRLGLQEALLRAAHANGYRGSSLRIHDGNLRQVLQHAFPGSGPNTPMQVGISSLSLSGILSNIANKFILASFMATEQTYNRIAAKRNVKDFKTVTSYRMTGGDTFQEVGPDGALKHATIGEESYTNRAKTYGRFWTVSREDIINDDMGVLDQKPRRIGRGGGLKLNSVFWAAFQANANTSDSNAFWSTAHKNVATGGGSALQSSALKTALQKFRDQTDTDGDPVDVEPRFLLVPTALEITAWELVKSPSVVGPTDAKTPNANAWAGRFELLVSKYLTTSATAWWLLCDPADLPTIEICYLDGNEAPTVQMVEVEPDTLGFGYRGFFDFGVAVQDYRGSVKSNGA